MTNRRVPAILPEHEVARQRPADDRVADARSGRRCGEAAPALTATQPVDGDEPEITIVLADDHAVVRHGLRLLLEAEEDMEVVAEAGDVDAAQRFVLGHKPTVLVLDLNMPGGSSLEAIPRVAETSPDTTVVVLTMQDDPPSRARPSGRGRAATC
jgi:CheY-like chemotaxis protein